ncbi:MAG: hypothetical protein LAT82_04260 [Nanoarchaeota archaeon]|nr:hypothetical protein [Nanoarchaeota archaeon]
MNAKLVSTILSFFLITCTLNFSYAQDDEFQTHQMSLNFFDEHNEIKSQPSEEEVIFFELYNLKLEPTSPQYSGLEGFIAKSTGSTLSLLIGFFVIGIIIYFSITKKI